jgi:ABC-type nitrate/sulfonate/bicarbonate transport system, permease component
VDQRKRLIIRSVVKCRVGGEKMKNDFRLRQDICKQTYFLITAATFIFIIGCWIMVTTSGMVKPMFLPQLSSVFANIFEGIKDTSLCENAAISIYRITMGFLAAAALGIPLGILCGSFKKVEAVISPLCEFIRYMPVPAFVPLVMVWAGIDETAKIIVVFIGTFFQMALMIADDARAVSEDLLSASYTLGTKRWSTIFKVLIPAMGPRIMLTLRITIGWAWTYLVVAELVASNSGLGYTILRAQRFFNTDAIFAGILIIGILGLITDRLFAIAIKKMFPWDERSST